MSNWGKNIQEEVLWGGGYFLNNHLSDWTEIWRMVWRREGRGRRKKESRKRQRKISDTNGLNVLGRHWDHLENPPIIWHKDITWLIEMWPFTSSSLRGLCYPSKMLHCAESLGEFCQVEAPKKGQFHSFCAFWRWRGYRNIGLLNEPSLDTGETHDPDSTADEPELQRQWH